MIIDLETISPVRNTDEIETMRVPFNPGFRVKDIGFPTTTSLEQFMPRGKYATLKANLALAWDEIYAEMWIYAQERADEFFGEGTVVRAEGQDGYTLSVDDLGDFRKWDGADLWWWHKFRREVLRFLNKKTSHVEVVERLQLGSALYQFGANRSTACA